MSGLDGIGRRGLSASGGNPPTRTQWAVDFASNFRKCMGDRKRVQALIDQLPEDFDPKEIIAGMSRLKGSRRKPTSVALEEDLVKELKGAAKDRGIPYQILMRLLISEGLKRLKRVA